MTAPQFEVLAKQYMDMIFRLAFSHLRSQSDADDVTQNVLFSLYKTNMDFENEAHIRHWLVRVTLNECRKHWRSPWSRYEDFTQYSETLRLEEAETGELFQAIMALDRKYRVLIVLYYYEGYSIAEIAGMLGIPQGTVGTRLARARKKLKQYLTEAYCDE